MFKSVVKVCGSTVKLQLKLAVLSTVEVGGKRKREPATDGRIHGGWHHHLPLQL